MPPPYPSYVSCYGEDPDDASGCGVYHVHILIQERHRRLTSVGQVRIHDAAGDWRKDQSSQGKSLDTRGEWHKEEVECPICVQCSLSRAETPDSLMICVPISYRSSRSFSTTHHTYTTVATITILPLCTASERLARAECIISTNNHYLIERQYEEQQSRRR